MRFSAEDAIRYFINAYPKQTLAALLRFSRDRHYHVRRLASEGTRPKLPWAQKINIPIQDPLPILDNLFSDKTRFVTRSVANHLNDISKINPELTLMTLKIWQQSGKQDPKEMEYITNHSLRTLIKQGYKNAITYLNFSIEPEVTISDFTIIKNPVKIGTSLDFALTLTALKEEQVLIDYIISYQNKKGAMSSKKIFKIKKLNMLKNQKLTIQKRHPMRENMTTRTLYPGEHKIEIQINGKIVGGGNFDVT